MGPGYTEPGMFDPEGKRGKTMRNAERSIKQEEVSKVQKFLHIR